MSRDAASRFRPTLVLAAIGLTLGLSACSGTTTNGQDNPLGASSNQPVPGAGPHLGATTSGGVTVDGASLRKSGPGIAVLATVTSDHPDQLLSIGSNYTATTRLPKPLAVLRGTTTTIDPTTAVLQPAGPIDDGATVAVSFTFATAGNVQVYATYHA